MISEEHKYSEVERAERDLMFHIYQGNSIRDALRKAKQTYGVIIYDRLIASFERENL